MADNGNRVIYYNDELNDEFSKAQIEPIKIDEKYEYVPKNIFWKTGHFFVYRFLATPFAFIYTKIAFLLKVKNKKVLKKAKNGYFIYANHTQEFADAFIPSVVTFPKRAYVIVHPNNVSMKGLKTLIPLLGALPLPDDFAAAKNFMNAIKLRCRQKKAIVIYPEAHIWPFFNGIRNFKSESFKYPIIFDKPVFAFTNVYKKRKHGKKPKIIAYVDGPFYPDESLNKRENEIFLRNCVYNAMKERSAQSDIEYIKYCPMSEKYKDDIENKENNAV